MDLRVDRGATDMLTEKEAWLLLATLIGGAPESMVSPAGHRLSGLCSACDYLYRDGLITQSTANAMYSRLKEATEFNPYLTIPMDWINGVRLNFCLQAIKECK